MKDSEKVTHAILPSLLTSFFPPTSDDYISHPASLSSSYFSLSSFTCSVYSSALVCSQHGASWRCANTMLNLW